MNIIKYQYSSKDIGNYIYKLPAIDEESDIRYDSILLLKKLSFIAVGVLPVSLLLAFITKGLLIWVMMVNIFVLLVFITSYILAKSTYNIKKELNKDLVQNNEYRELCNHLDEIYESYIDLDEDFIETKRKISKLRRK